MRFPAKRCCDAVCEAGVSWVGIAKAAGKNSCSGNRGFDEVHLAKRQVALTDGAQWDCQCLIVPVPSNARHVNRTNG
jgi:hypothetical protein